MAVAAPPYSPLLIAWIWRLIPLKIYYKITYKRYHNLFMKSCISENSPLYGMYDVSKPRIVILARSMGTSTLETMYVDCVCTVCVCRLMHVLCALCVALCMHSVTSGGLDIIDDITLSPCHMMHSGADVYDRVSMFLETLYRSMKRGLCGQNAVLVSHGLFCRLFIMRFYHWTVGVIRSGRIANPPDVLNSS